MNKFSICIDNLTILGNERHIQKWLKMKIEKKQKEKQNQFKANLRT